MDVEFLIREILARPPLWDQKDKSHHNRFVLDRLWSEVAVTLKTTPTVVRNKWKTLRDKFRTTIKSEDDLSNDYRSEWKYFKSLLFLKDQFSTRKSSGNFIENNIHDTIVEDSTTTTTTVIESAKDSVPGNRPSSSVGKKSEVKPSNKRSIGDVLLQKEKEKVQFLQEKRAKREEEDEDLNFFKSLLPHVRTFSAYDKMDYRIRIMKITQDYLQSTQRFTPVSNWSVGDTNATTGSNFYDNAERNFNLSELARNSDQDL